MPFSKENRMTTLIIIAVLWVFLFGMWGIVLVNKQVLPAGEQEYERASQEAHWRTFMIVGVITLIVKGLFMLVLTIRSSIKVKKIEEQTNGNVETALKEVREAEKDQVIDDPSLPDRLKPMIREVIKEVCEEFRNDLKKS